MDARIVRFGSRQLLMSKPRGHALGLTVADVTISLLLARETGAFLAYVRRRSTRHSALLALTARGARKAPRWQLALARAVWSLFELPTAAAQVHRRLRNAAAGLIDRAVRPGAGRSSALTQEMKARRREIYYGYDLRRIAADSPMVVEFPPAVEARVRALAREVGLNSDSRIITLHARESSSKPMAGEQERDRDSVRSANIDTYFPAIDYLVAKGFTVVRLGDRSMTPIAKPGVIDLATAGPGDLALDLWCVAHSRFFMACDSGPYLYSWLFNVPCLAVNIVNVLGVFPLRSHDLYLVKRVRDVHTGDVLSLSDMLATDVVFDLRKRVLKEKRLAYLDNTDDEIRDGVEEMVETLERVRPESPEQMAYRRLLERARRSDAATTKVVEKTGLVESFVGYGRIAHGFAVRHLERPIVPRQQGA